MLNGVWNNLGRGGRIGLIVGLIGIVMATALAGILLLRTDYRVLFADLAPQDAGAMIAELDRMKIPYKLGADGTSILVDADTVHKTRIKLMGKDLPLHGTVGFELFNNADFGMTEFAQKINYQRALQGEITRTILSLSEIESARVHLALPEEGMFKRTNSKAKAAITLGLKRGQSLRAEQVAGIQRLVSSAVPAILTQDVTIVDQHGVALTKVGGESETEASSSRLDLKKEAENYLSHKVDVVLERAFGVGQAMSSVDVTLNMDQVRITTEDVLGAPGKSGSIATGVVIRERDSQHDGAAPLDAKTGDGISRNSGSSQREVEYQVGRRIEQVVSAPGAIHQIHVVAVIRKAMNAAQTDQVKQMIFAAAGASYERGDTVVVQVQDQGNIAPVSMPIHDQAGDAAATVPVADAGWFGKSQRTVVVGALLLLVLVLGVILGLIFRRPVAETVALTDAERQAALSQINNWLSQGRNSVTQDNTEKKYG